MGKKRTLIIIVAIIGSILISLIANLTVTLIQNASYPKKYTEHVEKYASAYNVPEYVIYAVISVESDFNASLKSDDGSLGLMQINAEVFKKITADEALFDNLDFESLTEPETAIHLGTYYLRKLFNKYKSWSVAFAAYDASEAEVDEWLDNPKYSKDGETLKNIPKPKTKSYVKSTERASDYYQNKYYKNGVSVK
ncbi:MAG: lytic transglycosylase domain-containing protein [Clostridia bacterium]|nr:lytic transglycosylase domain-containing protein [Clostridia bacterium]